LGKLNTLKAHCKKYTVWAVDFKTPVGSSTFFSYAWVASAKRNIK
jgi:hypothetical protein